MALDALISDTARAFRDSLLERDREEFNQAIDALLDDPTPDGTTKVELPFPYRSGTFGFDSGSFWIAYLFLNAEVLYIVAAYWSPDSPRDLVSHKSASHPPLSF